MTCNKKNCPFTYRHSHGMAAAVLPSEPPKDLDLNLPNFLSEFDAIDRIAKAIGPIGSVIYDPMDRPNDGENGPVYFMTGPIDMAAKFVLGAMRDWVILEPGCQPRIDNHDYSKIVNAVRAHCRKCGRTIKNCDGHSPDVFVSACILCGAKNRVQKEGIEKAICGRCKKPLF